MQANNQNKVKAQEWVVMFDGKIVGEKDNKNVTDRELGLLMAGVV